MDRLKYNLCSQCYGLLKLHPNLYLDFIFSQVSYMKIYIWGL